MIARFRVTHYTAGLIKLHATKAAQDARSDLLSEHFSKPVIIRVRKAAAQHPKPTNLPSSEEGNVASVDIPE
jgi:hypothetical protein